MNFWPQPNWRQARLGRSPTLLSLPNAMPVAAGSAGRDATSTGSDPNWCPFVLAAAAGESGRGSDSQSESECECESEIDTDGCKAWLVGGVAKFGWRRARAWTEI